MKRKTFLKLSSSFMATSFISPVELAGPLERLKNWAGNFTFSTDSVFYPTTVEEVQSLVKKTARLKPLGTRHCFNRIADSRYNLVSTKNLNKYISIDAASKTVTVDAGIKYGELAPYLHEHGYGLHNLASLPHISVAGSIATATHGSGVLNGNLASIVTGLEMVLANGDIVNISKEKDGDKFLASVVGLGALGLVTKVTLGLVPTFMMKQQVFLKMPLAELKQNFEKIVSSGYSVSLFTDWSTENINEVWIKSLVDDPENQGNKADFYGATPAIKDMHPIADISAVNCTPQMGVPGPWYERLPHFKMGFTPSSGKELQSEFFIPFENAVDAIMAIQKLAKQVTPHLLITEIRTIAQDDLWMSPCYKQKSVTIHFTWKPEWEAVKNLLPLIEKALDPFKPKPHWGKLFTMDPAVLASRYEKFDDFKLLANTYDPTGKFRNEFLGSNIFFKK